MANTPQKVVFAQKLQVSANKLAAIRIELRDLAQVYLARKYQDGQTDPITDTDLAGQGITKAQLASYVETFSDRLNKLMTNQTVTSAVDGDAITANMRTDV
jgi:hypothetical protein